MKQTRLLVILLSLAMVFSLAACTDPTGNTDPCDHVDTENDMLCDLCGAAGCYNHADSNGDIICDFCGAEIVCDGNHVDSDGDYKCDICDAAIPCNGEHTDGDTDGFCDRCEEELPGENNTCTETHADSDLDLECDDCGETYETITVGEALELCGESGNITAERYYVRATVKTVSNAVYGEMTLVDESGEIYVYGTYNHTGAVQFGELASKPQRGDEVVLHCILQNYNGTKEIKNARLVGFVHKEADISEYTAMTVADARNAEEGELIIVEGVVARITYANGKKPVGVILVDGTQSIYVYGADVAGTVAIGNNIKVAGVKDYWILEDEASSAAKFGYEGCNQLSDAILLENDGEDQDFDKSWITETTVKAIMDTPVSENITSSVFKVNALVKKVPGSGFINYYIDDIDGVTGSYVYTQCNGSDFDWLDEFDGKICTVYLTALNAKSSTSGCVWRFLPIAVIDEGYVFDAADAPEFAVTYYGLTQFLTKYTGDPAKELVTSVSSELLGFENATLSYSSDNEQAVYFTNDGTTVFHCGEAGTANVTVTATHNGNTYSATVTVTVSENAEIDYIEVADAIAAPIDTTVTVRGIVGPSLVNQQGFYLFGKDGSMIAVKVNNADIFESIAIGHEIVITGMRERYIKDDSYTTYGQDAIVNAEVIANYYGNHEYSTDKFITGKTLADIAALDVTKSHSTEVYIVTVTVEVVETQYFTSIKITHNGVELSLYCNSASQYNWLKAYAGQEVTIELAPCNWNEKTSYRGCVLAVYNEDGTKTYNTLNFN